MRAPGMTWFRMPLFLWSTVRDRASSTVLGTPVIASPSCWSRRSALSISASSIPALGGDPVLFQHLFWFLLASGGLHHGAAAMGVVSELVAAFCRKAGVRLHFVPFASLGDRGARLPVWGHHMFVAGQSVYAALIFSILSFLVAIPSPSRSSTGRRRCTRGAVSWDTPMLYADGFIGLFTIGGLTGLFLAAVGLDVHVTDTYFIVAHFHYIMVGGTIMAYLGGLHYWWPKMSGRLYNEAARPRSARRSSSSAST
jgi:cytochrome c oxidase subunit 1